MPEEGPGAVGTKVWRSTRIRPAAPGDGPRRVLDLDVYIPYLLAAIANKWSRSSSRLYLKTFGVGVTEWRVMAMLAIEPRITAHRICQVIGLDKAAVSRSLAALERRSLVTADPDSGGKRKRVALTAEGYALHDRVMAVALAREDRLLADLSVAERQQLAGLLRRVLPQLAEIVEYDVRRPPQAPSGD